MFLVMYIQAWHYQQFPEAAVQHSVLLHKHFAGKVTEASRATHEEANLRLK